MNNAIKILLTINLEGGTLVRQGNPELIKFDIVNDLTDKKHNSGFKKHRNLVTKDCIQRTKLTVDAYQHMIETPPEGMNPKFFNTLCKVKRVESHLWQYCKDLKGKSFTYEILEGDE